MWHNFSLFCNWKEKCLKLVRRSEVQVYSPKTYLYSLVQYYYYYCCYCFTLTSTLIQHATFLVFFQTSITFFFLQFYHHHCWCPPLNSHVLHTLRLLPSNLAKLRRYMTTTQSCTQTFFFSLNLLFTSSKQKEAGRQKGLCVMASDGDTERCLAASSRLCPQHQESQNIA